MKHQPILAALAAPCVLAIGMAIPREALADTAKPVTLIVGGKPVAFVVPPFLGDDGLVYAPVDVVRVIGGSYTPNPDGRTVTVRGASGSTSTIGYRLMQQRYCVPVQQLANTLGATETWDSARRTLTLRARVLMIRQDESSLNVFTSYPIYYHVQHINNPSRVYVDLYGVDLAASPSQIPATSADVSQIRTGKTDFNTARVVIDLKREVKFNIDASMQTDHVRVALGIDSSPVAKTPAFPVSPPVTARPPAVVATRPPARPQSHQGSELPQLPVGNMGTPPSGGDAPVRITGLSVNNLSDTVTQVIIKATGTTRYRTLTLKEPNRLALDLAGAGLEAGLENVGTSDSPLVRAVRAGIVHAGKADFGRVVIDLAKIVDYSITTQPGSDGTTYLVNLETGAPRPRIEGNGSLRGKIVMVDPGHGGSDSGALGAGGAMEKVITLQIGKRLAEVLRSSGATVYMTRDGDTLPSVQARPAMANSINADYFISVHCDSSGPANSHSGTTVYYHAQNAVCRRLASDISRRVGDVSGIPVLGTRSDTVRFQTGFGVLRASMMPAVLVETGYINNVKDLAKIADPAIQQSIAEGITAGLIDFVAERGAE